MTRSLLQRLDDAANMTGIPQVSQRLAQQQQRRRHLRWTPLVTLAVATLGLVLSFVRFPFGLILLVLPQGWSGLIAMFGPLKPWGALEGVDERDIALRRDAYLFGFAVACLFMLTGMALLAVVGVVQAWTPASLIKGFAALWLYDLLLVSVMPTLFASWTTRPIDDE